MMIAMSRICASFAVLMMMGTAFAGTITWRNVDGGDFTNGANWSGGVAPGSADTALFDSNAEYRVTFSGPATTRVLTVRDGNVTFDTGAFTYSIVGDGVNTAYIGDAAGKQVTFKLTNGVISCADRVVVSTLGRAAIVVDHASWNIQDRLYFYSGSSVLVTNGGSIYLSGAHGQHWAGSTTIVSGASSRIYENKYTFIWGTVRVENGARYGGTRTFETYSGSEFTLDDGTILVRREGNGYTNCVQAGAVLQGNGLVMCSSTAVDNTNYVFWVRGSLRPGNTPRGSVGSIDFRGAREVELASTGVFEMDLGGTDTNSYDRIGVFGYTSNGVLSLAGNLQVSLVDGFVPKNGDRFDLLDWSNLRGAFQSISLPDLPGSGSYWKTNNLYITGEIEAVMPRWRGTMMLVR